MRFFDTHCHLAGEELLPTSEELASRAEAASVRGLAIISADLASLRAAPTLSRQLRASHPAQRIVYSAGLHPHEVEPLGPEAWAEWERLVREPDAVAVGETGLDYYYDHSDRASQRAAFDRHIEMACELAKPLVIHCRNAADDVLSLLDRPAIRRHPNPGILHCFTENAEVADRLLDLGFHISFSGIVSFRNAEDLRAVAKRVPSERLLIETDSPWLAPIPHRGKRNEPAFVPAVFEVLRGIRDEAPEALAEILWRNSCRVFGLDPEVSA